MGYNVVVLLNEICKFDLEYIYIYIYIYTSEYTYIYEYKPMYLKNTMNKE